ncbi:MAG: hypothetical protein KAJ05_05340 [Candidatus Latescibacteria bacterium]|nr:hypothetical protein [Candidatus Latescibacterota bacterium]
MSVFFVLSLLLSAGGFFSLALSGTEKKRQGDRRRENGGRRTETGRRRSYSGFWGQGSEVRRQETGGTIRITDPIPASSGGDGMVLSVLSVALSVVIEVDLSEKLAGKKACAIKQHRPF